MVFVRTVVLFFANFCISWTLASTIHPLHRDQESVQPVRPGYDNESINHLDESEYLTTEKSESVHGSSNQQFRNHYEAQIYKIYEYITSPEDKYIERLTDSSFIFRRPLHLDDSDKTKAPLIVHSFANFLENPAMKNQSALLITQIALKRVKESCDELKKTLDPYTINGEATTLQKASGFTSEESQHGIKVVLLNIASAKSVLPELQKTLDSYKVPSNSNLKNNIVVLSLEELIDYTVSVMTSVRGSWKSWRLISYCANIQGKS